MCPELSYVHERTNASIEIYYFFSFVSRRDILWTCESHATYVSFESVGFGSIDRHFDTSNILNFDRESSSVIFFFQIAFLPNDLLSADIHFVQWNKRLLIQKNFTISFENSSHWCVIQIKYLRHSWHHDIEILIHIS